MQIKDILKNYEDRYPIKKFQKSERAEIVKMFVDRINEDRVKANYKPLGANIIAIKMAEAGLKTEQDLYWFYAYCNEARNFSSCWWWSLKPSK